MRIVNCQLPLLVCLPPTQNFDAQAIKSPFANRSQV